MLPKQTTLGPLELKILNILWTNGPSTAREVLDALPPDEPRHYNTISTVLNRLARRGIVSRERTDRSHRFTPEVTRDELANEYLGLVREDLCGGSWNRLLAALLTQGKPSPDQLAALRAQIAALEQEEETDG